MHRVIAAVVVALSLTVVSSAVAKPHPDRAATLAVIGDTPYGVPQADNFANDIAELNADSASRLVLHLGDIKDGSSVCTTDYFERIRADFDLFDKPFVYTPGDNEWTDCHRANNGGYLPAGPAPRGSVPSRLDEVRRIFFDRPGRSLGSPRIRVERQYAPYVENVAWGRAGAQFSTVHIVGSNNDAAPWFGAAETAGQKRAQAAEVAGRRQAALRWIDHTFRRARATGARAVVIGIQADMWDPEITGTPASYSEFTPIVRRLAARARRFGRPVLLLNGDSHKFTDDRPLDDTAHPENRSIYGIDRPVPNLRRITTNGSTTPCHEWIRLRVAPREREPFTYDRVRFAKQPGFDPAVCPPGR